MIHIGLLFEYATLNGGEQSMLSVLQILQSDDHFCFTAFGPGTGPLPDELTAVGVPVIPFDVRDEGGIKRPADRLLDDLRQTAARCQRPLDLLHANSLSMARLVGQLKSARFVRTGHLRDIIKLNRKVITDLNACDRLVAVSVATRDFHVSQGLDEGRCDVLYNGVDTARFCPRPSPRHELLPVPADAVVVLNVGQICLRKGQRDLAYVVAGWPDGQPPLHLVLVGQRHSTKQESVAYEREIADIFARADRSDRLHRPGYRGDVARWMNAADLLVHTARQEPLGRVLLEAAACELPIVATQVGGTAEILNDGQSAWLVPPDSAPCLRSAIREALQDSRAAGARAVAARRQICAQFDVRQAAWRLGEFWQQAVDLRRQNRSD